ncbi:stage V sporulation protein AB [Parageobacillus thermoglucosidasius]|uniref:Stage V sporulation protein AB n=2 Tax=Parageobacillus thermoglucosidasius TaxID=1426 RepID=A0AAN1D7Y2_PARTM|nr:stage V sporulation protein AB [Parageobacillus thermoglucosidasius]AEH47350.1 stage V sporulation protein AB [Parageobacillus thermoglucosidasius C56-YS93]ALF11409.1 stage V sporulation protein AB [Parageobacillus thermoglucosidasius]ANZ31486.1 stage V sporulation protein AB [Parageobacillus thermoglucosidasius]APM82223.1 stage V sporulation protein AB [Parageobacillus thermoglucosidasius]KJX69047.1 stage V sporulation protein AB [Parageobacillus thermoglucosidasius]
MTIKILAVIFIGFAGGLAVGTGFVAFLVVLGVIPRLTQLTKTTKRIRAYEWSAIAGAVAGGWMSLRHTVLYMSKYWLIPLGLLQGVFIGMLAAALTEVLNVWPILAKRVGVADKIVILLMAIAFGKIVGSLFHWIYFTDYLR